MMHHDAVRQARAYCAAYPRAPYSVWLGLALDHIDGLEAMIDTFAEQNGWATAAWKCNPGVAELFEDAKKRHP